MGRFKGRASRLLGLAAFSAGLGAEWRPGATDAAAFSAATSPTSCLRSSGRQVTSPTSSRAAAPLALEALPASAAATDALPAVLVLAGVLLAALGLRDEAPEAETSEGRRTAKVQQAGPFRYCVDRCFVNFDQAFYQLAAMQPDLGAKQLPLFAYLPDSYEGPELPEAGPAGAVTLFHRSVTDEFDDKRSLARKMQAAGCEGAFAPSFLTVEAALKDTSWRSSRADEDLFFVKPSCGSGGRGIRVLNREQLSRESIDEEQCVVQRAVQDIETIEGRKFVLRFYLVIHDGAIFMHRRGVVIVHDAPYEQSSANYDVQVCHDGMHEAGSGELLRAMHLQPDGERWREAIRRRVQEIYCGLQPIVQASSKSLYTIIGGDALIESTGEARLIELNFYPNLGSQNGVLNADVKQPMLRDALSQVLLGVPPSELELVLPPELV